VRDLILHVLGVDTSCSSVKLSLHIEKVDVRVWHVDRCANTRILNSVSFEILLHTRDES